MGSKRPANAPNYNPNLPPYSYFPAGPGLGSTDPGARTSDIASAQNFSNLSNRGKPFNAVQVAAAQSQSPLVSSYRAHQCTFTPQSPLMHEFRIPDPTSPVSHTPYRSLSGPATPSNAPFSIDSLFSLISQNHDAITAILENKLLPGFKSLSADIQSVKASLKDTNDELSTVKKEIQVISGVQKENHVTYAKALKSFTDKATDLEALLGHSRLGYEGDDGRTVMGRLDEIYLALGDMVEKMADREADATLQLSPHSMPRDIGDSPSKSALLPQATDPEISTPQPSSGSQGVCTSIQSSPGPASCSRTETPALQTPAPIPHVAVDVVMAAPESEGEAGASAKPTSMCMEQPSFSTSSPKPQITGGRSRLECSVSPIARRQSEVLHGFSKVNWEREAERRSASATPVYQPPPISPACRQVSPSNIPRVGSPLRQSTIPPSASIASPTKSRQEPASGSVTRPSEPRLQGRNQDQEPFRQQTPPRSHDDVDGDTVVVTGNVSPALTETGLLPDLEYPTRETTVIDDSPTGRDGVDDADDVGDVDGGGGGDEGNALLEQVWVDEERGEDEGDDSDKNEDEEIFEDELPRAAQPQTPPHASTVQRADTLSSSAPEERYEESLSPPEIMHQDLDLSDVSSLSDDDEPLVSSPEASSPAPAANYAEREQESQREVEEVEEQSAPGPTPRKGKTPLFLPESRTATPGASQGAKVFVADDGEELENNWDDEDDDDEEKEEKTTEPVFPARSLPLFFPESRVTTASPGFFGDTSGFRVEREEERRKQKEEERELTHSWFSAGENTKPAREMDPGLDPERQSATASPSPEENILTIDVSQFEPPRSQDPASTNSPEPEAKMDAQGQVKTPTSRPADMSSSDEVTRIAVELATLSEPLSSSEDESDDEDEVDQLLPDSGALESELEPESEHGLEPEREEMEDIQESFTPRQAAATSSIQSFDTLPDALNGLRSPVESPGSAQGPSAVRKVKAKESLSLTANGTGAASSLPSISSVLLDASVHVDAANEASITVAASNPSPSKDLPGKSAVQPESMPGPSPPRPSTPTNTRTKDKAPEEPATPLALPTYLSPVASPLTSPAPTAKPRKRKLEDMNMPVVGVQQLGSQMKAKAMTRGSEGQKQHQSPTQAETASPTRRPIRMMKPSSRPPPPLSPTASDGEKSTAALRPPPSSARVTAREARKSKRLRKENDKPGKEGDSPIYISSTPSTPTTPTGKDKGVECIDLTGSPVGAAQTKALPPREKREKTVKSVNGKDSVKKKGKQQSEREREREREKEKKREKEEQERKEKQKKREKEKKLLPVGAEDSDDAEVIPAKAYKRPVLRVDTREKGEGSRVGSTKAALQKSPDKEQSSKMIDFRSLVAKQDANGKESKAVTKVKRRGRPDRSSISTGGSSAVDGKAAVWDEEDEPPLKRAKLRSAEVESVASSGDLELGKSQGRAKVGKTRSDKGKGKENINGEGNRGRKWQKEKDVLSVGIIPPSSPIRIKWPAKKSGETTFQKNFIECDLCHSWYHYGCVGIQPGDIRLEDTEIFACPPCEAGRPQVESPISPIETSAHDACSRPDCGFRTTQTREDEYFVRRIIGRRCKFEGGRGRVEEWLVEWDGYPITEATWENDSSMDDPVKLIESFVAAAEKEGLDLDENPNATVLLKDARRNGWGA